MMKGRGKSKEIFEDVDPARTKMKLERASGCKADSGWRNSVTDWRVQHAERHSFHSGVV